MRYNSTRNLEGFSLIELLIVLGIIGIIGAFSAPLIRLYTVEQVTRSTADETVSLLRKAHSRAMFGDRGTDWGVYFDPLTQEVTLFSGDEYANRDATYDEIREFRENVQFSLTSQADGSVLEEVVFEALEGNASDEVLLEVLENGGYSITYSINQFGKIEQQ